MNPILQFEADTPSISPESVPRWCSPSFFRQEAPERWLLLVQGMVFMCNRSAYEVLRRVDGSVTVRGLLEQVQGILPDLTLEEVRQLLLPFVEICLLELGDPQQVGCSPTELDAGEG